MSNKFVSILETAAKNFNADLKKILPWLATTGEAAVAVFAPAASPMFNATVGAVLTAEQNAAAVGQSKGTGPQKLSAVVGIVGNLVKQGLADAGQTNDEAAVTKYVNSVVTILNTTPSTATPSGS